MRKLTQDEFVIKASLLHGNKFCYSSTVYKNRRSLIEVRCPVHGIFIQKADSHLQGRGCDKCSGTSLSNLEDWKNKIFSVHRDEYFYDKSVYITNKKKLTITCKLHGDFEQTPDNHLSGQGCPMCAKYGYKKSLPGSFYILIHDNKTKVGITNFYASKRAKDINKTSKMSFKPVFEIRFEDGSIAKKIESLVLKYLQNIYKGDSEIYDGYTEVFLDVNYPALVSQVVKVCGEVFASKN